MSWDAPPTYPLSWKCGNQEASQVFAALSQETRLAVLRLLIAAGPNGLPAGEIADRLGLPGSTTSFHLSALERAGLTQCTRQGRQIVHASASSRCAS